MKALYLTLALVAGLAGGMLSHYVWPRPVAAQAPPATPQEIRAQRFILEDAAGKTLGTFSAEVPRNAIAGRGTHGAIRLFDDRGRELWRSPSLGILPATE